MSDAAVTDAAMMTAVDLVRFEAGVRQPAADVVAVEDPLEIRLAYRLQGRRVVKPISITMRTPGADAELAAGFLVGEGLLRDRAEVIGIDTSEPNQVTLELRNGADVEIERLQRSFYATSSCGICGRASLQALEALDAIQSQVPPAPASSHCVVSSSVLESLPGRAAGIQSVFAATGGLHAAALFSLRGECLRVREDVGRHNALDKLVGSYFLEGKTPLSESILLLSGRASFELMQKAWMGGIPIIAAVGAPSSLAVDLARRFDRTLIGFLRGQRFNVYSGEQRVQERSARGGHRDAASGDGRLV